MPKPAPRSTGEIGVYTGKTRSGKSYQLKKRTRRHRRVIVWSVKETIDRYADNWPDSRIIRSLGELKAAIQETGAKSAHLIYLPPSLRDFEGWCKLAHAWGIIAPCSAIAEEIADVTTPSKAPDGWGNLIRQGAGWGINIYGVTQRPAESDKTIVGNMSFLHAHQVMRAKDRDYIAAEMDLPVAEIAALRGFAWVERWATGEVKRGK